MVIVIVFQINDDANNNCIEKVGRGMCERECRDGGGGGGGGAGGQGAVLPGLLLNISVTFDSMRVIFLQ